MPRILSIDLARGFTVLVMPSVHVVMLYSNPVTQRSVLGYVLAFFADGPGAALLMFLMGVSFSLCRKVNKQHVLNRTLAFLTGAFVLNFYKFVLPLQLDLLPKQLIQDTGYTNPTTDLLLMGDILQFAAISYPILFLIIRLYCFRLWSAVIAITIMLISPYVWDVNSGNLFVDQLLQYFWGHPPRCYFPVFPWLVYPLAGLAIAPLLQSRNLFSLGILILAVSLSFPETSYTTSYRYIYRTEPADTFFHLGIVITWMTLARWVSQQVTANPVFQLLVFCSKHISMIYIVQWLLIIWSLPLAGYQELPVLPSLVWMGGVTITTLTIAKLADYVPLHKTI